MEDLHSTLIRQAVQQARQGNSKEALSLLTKNTVPDTSPHAAHYHQTLGILLFENGQTGEAFAHLDVARYRRPGISSLESAWGQAKAQLEQRQGEGSLNLASSTLERWVDHPFSLPLESLVAVAALILSLSCYRRASPRAARRSRLRWAIGAWILALSASGAHLAGSKYERARATEEILLRSGPSDDFLKLELIEAGVELRVLEEREGWVRVRVQERVSGWAPKDHVLLFRAPSTTRES